MTTGILGQSNPPANTYTTVYTVTAGLAGTFTISVVNIGATPAEVTISLSASGTPSASEYIEYQTPVAPGQVIERGGIVAQSGKNVVLYCSTNTCSVSIYGFEQ